MLDLFKAYIESERRLAENSVTAYMSDLGQFVEFSTIDGESLDWGVISIHDVRAWIVHMMDSGISARSVHRKISSLNAIYKYMMRHSLVEQNPVSLVVLPKVRKGLPFFVGVKDMNRLFDGSLFSDDFSGVRDRAIVALFYCSGVRLSELVGLTIGSYVSRDGTVRVMGKRSRERIVPLPRECITYLDEYVTKRASITGLGNRSLFLTDRGEQVYDKFVYRLVKRYLALVTTIEKRSPHVLRHTYATHMLNRGAELEVIKELLGHVSVVTTQEYTHSSFENLKRVYKQAHPRAYKIGE